MAFCQGKLGSVKRGAKVIKSQTKTILETVNTLYSISVIQISIYGVE